MDLPKNESIYLMDTAGDTTGTKYQGEFNFVCKLTLGQKRQLELERTRLLAELGNPTVGLENIATIVANLRVRTIKSPDWWQKSNGGMDLLDENIVLTLFDKAMEAETAWEEEVKKRLGKEVPPPTPST